MQSHPGETFHMVRKEADGCISSRYGDLLHSTGRASVELSSSSDKDNSRDTGDANDYSIENSSKHLVLYDPVANAAAQIESAPQPIWCHRTFGRDLSSRVLPSVGAFTVQCAKCFKWRLIPTKEKYEEIREHILEEPFFCVTAREWRPDISCDDATDISQDGSRLWAIDKPNIAQPPPGWQRLLRIRGEGSTKFADVYYQAPSGKRLRSMVEVQKYLLEHPEYMNDGVTLSQFSFQIPKPLQENYVRKKRPRITASGDNARPFEPGEAASPISWIGPGDSTELQLGRPALPPPTFIRSPVSLPFDQPVMKKARTPSKQNQRTNPVWNQDGGKIHEPDQSRNSGYDLHRSFF